MPKSTSTSRAVEVTSGSRGVAKCAFCHLGRDTFEEDLAKSGKFYRMGDNYYHYFCVLFSTFAVQSGSSKFGLFGFLPADLDKELRRSRKQICVYCRQKGANVECSSNKCHDDTYFHYPCGLRNGVRFIVDNKNCPSYCSKHPPPIVKEVLKRQVKVDDLICLAGCSEITTNDQNCLTTLCCGRRYHVNCLQEMSLRCGRAHYKCPVCSEKQRFLRDSIGMGIYVPEQDADWEKPEWEEFYNYAEMGELRQKCDAKKCRCPKGREHNVLGSNYEVIRCSQCGSKAVHVACGGLDAKTPEYICDDHFQEASDSEPEAKRRRSSPDFESSYLSSDSSSQSSSEDEDDFVIQKVLERRSMEQTPAVKRCLSDDFKFGENTNVENENPARNQVVSPVERNDKFNNPEKDDANARFTKIVEPEKAILLNLTAADLDTSSEEEDEDIIPTCSKKSLLSNTKVQHEQIPLNKEDESCSKVISLRNTDNRSRSLTNPGRIERTQNDVDSFQRKFDMQENISVIYSSFQDVDLKTESNPANLVAIVKSEPKVAEIDLTEEDDEIIVLD